MPGTKSRRPDRVDCVRGKSGSDVTEMVSERAMPVRKKRGGSIVLLLRRYSFTALCTFNEVLEVLKL